jgi:two component system regulator NtrZ-like protein (phosphatase activity inhibitor)
MVSLLVFGGFALPAMADQDVPEMPAPSMSETDRAEPDWFQKFSFNTTDINAPIWQARPSQTFNLAWITGDRWSLSLDLTSRDEESPLPREEMLAEAEFQITPRFSVGGELSIAAEELDDTAQWEDQEIEAGIRLRSAFKF